MELLRAATAKEYRRAAFGIAAVLGALALTACGGASPNPTPSPTDTSVLPSPTTTTSPRSTPDPAELQGGILATFDVQGIRFRAFVTNPQTIEELYALQRGESYAAIPNGRLVEGTGAEEHNAPWSWHLDPEDIHMAEVTIELCDGAPDHVENDLAYWLNTVERYCPWSAVLESLEDYREASA
ncbi:MAG: hypothetical protein HY532_08050 [Chloroflexi bacterium]|nr:hypothetical protein [Chloroflexota bacterium]